MDTNLIRLVSLVQIFVTQDYVTKNNFS